MSPSVQAAAENIIFPNGLIVKMGIETVAANTADDVTYGTAFPTACVVAFCTIKSATTNLTEPAQALPKSGSEDTILQVVNSAGTSKDIQWLALGY